MTCVFTLLFALANFQYEYLLQVPHTKARLWHVIMWAIPYGPYRCSQHWIFAIYAILDRGELGVAIYGTWPGIWASRLSRYQGFRRLLCIDVATLQQWLGGSERWRQANHGWLWDVRLHGFPSRSLSRNRNFFMQIVLRICIYEVVVHRYV